MIEPGSVFVGHAPEDTARCAPLVEVLRGWGVSVWFDTRDTDSEEHQSAQARAALTSAGTLLRICTRATRGAYWMSLETGAFLDLRGQDFRAGQSGQRQIINLVLDTAYTREPFDRTAVVIEAAGQPAQVWVNALRWALGLPPLAEVPALTIPPARSSHALSRRGLVGAGIAAALLAAGVGATVLLHRREVSGPPVAAPLDPRLRWRFKTGDNVIATPLVSGDAVYIGSNDQSLYALDATTGKQRWSYLTDMPLTAAPVPYQNTLFQFAAADVGQGSSGTPQPIFALIVLDPSTGKRIKHLVFPPFAPPISGPVLAGDVAVLTLSNSEVAAGAVSLVEALNAGSGLSNWQMPLSAISHATPVVAGGIVYIGADDGSFNALDLATGKPLWTFQAGGRFFGAAAVADGLVYTGADDGAIYALGAQRGDLRWHFATGGAVATTPVIANGLVYASSADGSIYALDAAAGTPRWHYATGGGVFSSPVVANKVVYCGSNDGHLYALDAQSGALTRRYQTGAAVVSSPAVSSGLVYCGSNDHYLYAFAL